MTILLFLIILGALVFVHELGHFVMAKLAGIRVDEFGIGFPPKIFSVRYGETEYSVNVIPFGGFVKIFGESLDDINDSEEEDKTRSFVSKSKWWQALILVAGVTCNIIFAWVLISVGFMIGQPTPVDYGGSVAVQDPGLVVLQIEKESPAEMAGLRVGDVVETISAPDASILPKGILDIDSFQNFVKMHQDDTLSLVYKRGDEIFGTTILPEDGFIEDRKGLGVAIEMIGTLSLPPHQAFWEGAKTTLSLTRTVAIELGKFFGRLFTGNAGFGEVTGPIGIVGLVGDAATLGFVHILSFTAIISIHLAIINLVPFPALDGGRLLFVIIEAIIRRPVPVMFFRIANTVGFVLLLGLMIVVTYNDILKLFL